MLNVAPREFNLYFNGGANLNESTINANTIRLVRSGGDGVFDGNDIEVALGYVGLVNPGSTDPSELQRIVLRPASDASHNATDPSVAFPDDLYQIQIIGSGASPLADRDGQAYNGGTDTIVNFRLDRGAQVLAVVPQPVTRAANGTLTQAGNQIVVYFDDQLLNRADAENPKFFRLVDTRATLDASDDQTRLPQSAQYDATNNTVTLTFATEIPEGTYRLDIGLSDGGSTTPSTAIRIGTLFGTAQAGANPATPQNRFTYNGYLGDSDGVHNNPQDRDYYRVELGGGARFRVAVTAHDSQLQTAVRLLDANQDVVAWTDLGDGVWEFVVPNGGAGTYFIEVASGDGSTGSYHIEATATGYAISTDDNNTTFATATQLGSLGAAGVRVAGRIQPQIIPLPPPPGGLDEPGHRQIQREAHIGASGTTPVVPSPNAEQTQRVFYHFPAAFANPTAPGQSFLNQITAEEKRIVYAILDVYASLSGYEFIETPNSGLAFGKTDLRAFDPTLGPNSGVAGLGGGAGAIANASLYQDSDRFYGDGFTSLMFHEIGHAIGLGHSYDILANQGDGLPNDLLPGDHDIIHLQRIMPTNSTDIDLYRFELAESGRLNAETFAERLATPSLLDTLLTLYRETPDGEREVIARNDRYFGSDSFISLDLEPGVYYIGVSSSGNDNYDPNVPDSGADGKNFGAYELSLSFEADRGGALRDADGTPIDGNGDGTPGGVHQFWFQASDVNTTIFVDRANDPRISLPDGDGSLSNPFDTLNAAMAAAGSRIVVPQRAVSEIQEHDSFTLDDGSGERIFTFGPTGSIDLSGLTTPAEVAGAIAAAINASDLNITATVAGRVVRLSGLDSLDLAGTPALLGTPNLVRIVGNGGLDGNVNTPADNQPYLIGTDSSGNPLRDGQEFLVPQGVTVMLDAGALIKLRGANLDAGTSSVNLSRAASAIQVLGTPQVPVWLRSYRDDTFGGNSDGVGPAPQAGDFGGIVFRADSDLEDRGIFLNHVTHVDIRHGGGTVFVDSDEQVFSPIHLIDARPSLRFNHIAQNADAAVSASPNSFEESLDRIGPDILGNYLHGNTIDGLFIRIPTQLGATASKLTVPGRFDDTDIPHVLTENLLISGNPGGPQQLPGGSLVARAAGRLVVDPGVVVKLSGARIEAERGESSIIAEGTVDRPVIFTSLRDDRYGGSGSFDTNSGGASFGTAGDWAGFYFGQVSSGSFDHALISFAGGNSPIEGGSAYFNTIEVHQAQLRISNSVLRDNAGGTGASTSAQRAGRGANQAAVLYVRGAQPIVVGNTFVDNAGPVVNLNANSLNFKIRPDSGRSTGSLDAYNQFADNHGPLVRQNLLSGNAINGMVVRGEELTTESIWDDTDIVHVLRGEVIVGNHHTYSGLRLQSSNSESLVIKLDGNTAGFTATGKPLDIIDRIGGTIQVLGTPGFPVVLTHLSDDSVGAGYAPDGTVVTNTTPGQSVGVPGGWRGFVFDEWSNDRNVAVIRERENPLTSGADINRTPGTAQTLGVLAPNEKSGDENRRLGFEVHGFISPDDPGDVDVYSFRGTAGTPIWIDVDRTDSSLDLIVEVLNANGTVLARSVRSGELNYTGNLNAATLTQNPLLGGDYYTQNFRDPGLYYVLPGTVGNEGTYFVRVRSNPQTTPITTLAGQSSGKYQMQIRLQQVDEFPGSTVQYADIRFAQTAIDVRGLPNRSPLVGEAGELPGDNNTYVNAQQLVNLLETDMAAISLAGELDSNTDVDWYRFDLQHAGVQVIGGANDDPGTVAVVFDIDFAHGAVRGDTTIAVYDQNQRLVFVGRESNVQDDRASSANATEDLSRGSFGNKDPYIGPIHLRPGGTYYVAVMNDRHLPSALTGAYVANPAQAGNGLVRLEPVNSVRRVVEDHIGLQGYSSNGVVIGPETPGIFDISTSQTLANHVVPFTLEDVVLYVATDVAGNTNVDGDHLYTVNPYLTERYLTRVSPNSGLVSGGNDVQDIVIRSDGRMFGYQRLDNNLASVGALVEINPTTGQTTVVGNDNIRGRSPVPNTSVFATNLGSHLSRAEQFTTSDEVDAFTFQRRSDTTGSAAAPVPTYNTYFVVRETDSTIGGGNSKLYRGRENGDTTPAIASGNNPRYGVMGDIQPAGVTFASRTLTVSNNANPAASTTIRIESKIPGEEGNSININITRPGNNDANVSVSGRTINLQIGGTGGPPFTGAPTAEAIVNAINNHADARQLVTAVIVGGNANANGDGANGTQALNVSAGGALTGGADGAIGPLKGRVTGISFGNFLSNGNLYGVTTAGEFIEIQPNSGTVVRKLDIANAFGLSSINFQGLTLGPQNVEGGTYANTLFAVTNNGTMYAIDTQLVSSVTDGNDATQVLGVMRNIFAGGSYTAQATGMSGNAVGLAFSPLDFNLWHTTMKRGNDAGHGINEAPDSSRSPGDVNVTINDPGPGPNRTRSQAVGGASLHFGFEQWVQNHTNDTPSYLTYETGVNAQLGIRTTVQHQDLSSNPEIAGTYNFPGGALGSLVSGEFSLAGSVADDRPTLYFNYFLNTENHGGSDVTTDVNDPFRDGARVYASRDGGVTWELVATNNSRLSGADPTVGSERAELPGFLSHLSDAGLNSQTPRQQNHQIVQELMDNTGQWRQARIDLSTFAGEESVQLRFDFTTAGAMRDPSLGTIDASFGEFTHAERSIRSLANAFEGFYIDDIIVGYAERGEMVTGAIADSSITNLGAQPRTQNRDGNAFPDVLAGRYQLEVRRVDEYAAGTDDLTIGTLFGTNDRHINDTTQTAWVNYELDGSSVNLTPSELVVGGETVPGIFIAPWTISTDQPLTGQRSLRSGDVTMARPVSVFQATAAELGSSSTAAGIIEFSYSVSSRENVNGLRFFIDGVLQTLDYSSSEHTPEGYDPTLASGESGYRTVSFPFGSGNPTFTWVYDFRNQSNPGGQNRAWIDDIKLMQGGTGLVADRNRQRPQGMFIIDSNTITDSSVRGINVQPGSTQAGGNVPHPGSTINFVQLNQERLVPGVVIQNNIVAGASGIRFAGETDANPQRPVPFGRIVNNTLVGDGTGVGIQIDGIASPTVMNNIITEFTTGIGGSTGSTVVQSNYFQANTNNGTTGANAVVQAAGTPLFVDAANGNYYLVSGSPATDSSLNTLQDRFNYVNFKNQIGIPPSPIVAPDRDVFGQLRVDSGQSGGGGATIFKDRGAVDRADFEAPFAVLLDPIDNDITGIDRDPNLTIVSLPNSVVESFSILLTDGRGPNAPFEGTGVDPLTVSRDVVTVHRNNRLLVEGVDYRIGYNDSTGEVRLTPLSTLWEPGGVYEIELDNQVIRDRAGNRLRNNQADGSTRFVIILPDVGFDFGDAPNSYGTLLGSDGARHAIINGAMPRLGRYVDSENGIGAVIDDTPKAIVATPGAASSEFVVTDSGSPQVTIQLAATPAVSGAALTVDVGSGPRTFELVYVDVAPQAGNVAVRFAASDTPEEIIDRLAAAITAELGAPGDALTVTVDGDTIELVNQDDEDGVGIGTLNSANGDYIVFLRPEETAYPQYPPTTAAGTDVLGFLNPLDPAGAQVAVTVTGSGYLDAWIDLNGNGVFDADSEKVLDSVAVQDGVNIVNIVTPAGTADAITWVRFRLSPEGGLQPTGLAVGGEVEDFQVQIVSVPLPVPADDVYTVNEDATLDTQGGALGTVVDNDTFSPLTFTPFEVVVVDGPEFASNFMLDPVTGHFVYEPLADFAGIDTFTYYVAIQQSAVDADITVTQPSIATVTIDVRPVNDAPLAAPQAFITLESQPVAQPDDAPQVGRGTHPLTITAEDLLANAVAHANPQYPVGAPAAPWDETDQSLRVVEITLPDGTVVNAANASDGSGAVVFNTVHGTLTARFVTTAEPDAPFGSSLGALIDLTYVPHDYLNRDNVDLQTVDVGGEQVDIFDFIRFTIEDDGLLIDPATIDPATSEVIEDDTFFANAFNPLDPTNPLGRLRHQSIALIDVAPQNDYPIPSDDYITVGPIGAGRPTPDGNPAPIDPLTAWSQYFIGLGLEVPVPTEDQTLVIPAGFLLLNDFVGQAISTDERGGINDSDLRITSVTLLNQPASGGGSVTVNDDGDVVFLAPTDVYGEVVFSYVIQDSGIDEDHDGNRPVAPLTATGTVTIVVQPANDAPNAFDRQLEFVEAGEPGVDRFDFNADQLLARLDADTPAVPGSLTPELQPPFTEIEQGLRVVAFATDQGSVDVAQLADYTGPGTGNGMLVLPSDDGGYFEFDIVNGALTTARFFAAPDYSERTPFAAVERLRFTIEDDGRTTDPQSGAVVHLPAVRSAEATLTITIGESNDAPIFTMPAGFTFDENNGQTVTQGNFVTVIAPGPLTALDELERQNVSFSFTPVNVPEGLMMLDENGVPMLPSIEVTTGGSDNWTDVDGNGIGAGLLTVHPAADAFGFAVYLVTATDDDPVNPRSTSQLLTITINPVNDEPAAYDRLLDLNEAVERDGEVAVRTFTREELLGIGSATPNVPGVFPADLIDPYNESEQRLRVVRFEIAGQEPVDATIDEPGLVNGTGTVTRITRTNSSGEATATSGILTFEFLNGEFVSGSYTSAVDYNEQTPFEEFDSFTYFIADDGRTTLPGSGFIDYDGTGSGTDTTIYLPELRSTAATVVLGVTQVNDPPVFNFLASVDILERDDLGETVVPGWATNILPSPSTALDELERQGVTFSFVGYGAGTSDPEDLFWRAPEVADDGTLSLFPRPDAVGTAIVIVRATDFEFEPSDDFQPRSTDATFTVNVRPVNDAPRLNPAVIGTEQTLNNDEQWRVDDSGVITYTLKEDNTQAQGVTQPYIIDMRRSTPMPGYGRIGLLDVFTVGPDNEADGTLGGDQILRLLSFDSTTALGGKIEAIGFDSFGNITQLQYTPPKDYNSSLGGVDSFTYVVQDNNPSNGETWSLDNGALGEDRRTASGRVEFVLRPVNDAPQFTIGVPVASVLEDSGLTAFQLFATNISAGSAGTAFDELDPVTGQNVTFSLTPVTPGASDLFATLPTINAEGTLSFAPADNAYGTAVFTVRAIDSGADDSGRGDINTSPAQTITINIRPVNDRPVLNTTTPISYTLNEDATILQPDGTVTFQGTFIPLRGDGAVVGLLDVFNVGPDNEAANITPGGNQSLRITTPIPGTTAQGGTLTRVFDPLDPTVLIGLRYTPRANFNGTDSFIYGVIDDGVSVDLDGNVTSDPREAFNTITLNVLPLNDRPQFSGPLSVTVAEDATTTPVIGQTIIPNFVTDITAGPAGASDELQNQTVSFTVTPVSGNADSLFVATPQVSSDGTLTFQTRPDANGIAVFTIVAVDNGPNNAPLEFNTSSPPRTFTITVNPVNDAPTFTAELSEIEVAEDSGPFTTTQPFATQISPGPADEVAAGQTVRFEVVTPVADEALFQTLPLVTDNGFLRFTPAENAVGTTVVSIVAIDSEGGISDPVLVTITITEVNDAPVAGDLTLAGNEDTVLPISEQTLLDLAVDPDLNTNPNEVLGFTQVASTSQAGATIRVLPSGDLEYDPRGSQTLQALRPGQTLTDTFTYRVIDASGAISNIATVTVNVTGVNDAPTVVNDFATLNPDGPTTIRPLDNDFDVDGTINPASLQITLQPAFGSVSVQGDGTLVYTPFPGFRGSDTIRYTVADETGARSEQATITIDMNEAPVAVDDISGTYRGRSIDIDVASNDFDPDGSLDLDSIEIITPPSGGTAIVVGGGIIRYLPGDSFVGIDTFEYTIRDERGRPSNVGQVRVQVVASELQNPNGVTDVNGSGLTTPLDALLILNRLARAAREGMPGSIPVELLLDETPRYFYDVSGNRRVEPLDALLVINEIARRNRERANGEGELAAVVSPPVIAASFVDTPASESAEPKLLSDPVEELDQAAKAAVFDWDDDEAYSLLASDIAETRREKERESTDEQLVDAIWSVF